MITLIPKLFTPAALRRFAKGCGDLPLNYVHNIESVTAVYVGDFYITSVNKKFVLLEDTSNGKTFKIKATTAAEMVCGYFNQ